MSKDFKLSSAQQGLVQAKLKIDLIATVLDPRYCHNQLLIAKRCTRCSAQKAPHAASYFILSNLRSVSVIVVKHSLVVDIWLKKYVST